MSRIIQLTASNVKRLRAVEIKPEAGSPTVIVGGRNAQGKSSVLDSILYALAGGKAIPGRPIREGEESAEIVVETEDFVVRRRFGPGGTRLEVTTPEGAVFRSPQAMLDQYVGAISFDPMAFIRASPREQGDMLRAALGVDTTEVEARRAQAFTSRRDAKRDLAAVNARLDAAPFHGDAPETEVSLDDLRAEYAEGQKHNRQVDEISQKVDRLTAEQQRQFKTVDRLRAELKAAEEAHDATVSARDEAYRELEAAADPIDLEEITARVKGIEETNRLVRENAAHAALSAQVRALRGEVETFDETIAACDEERARMLAEAGMPIDGLDVTDEGVTFGGIPLDQASMSEQIRISCAIAFTGDPKLRLAIVRDGSLLDGAALAELAEMAGKHEFQVWIERVGDGDAGAVIIEDGSVVGVEGGEG